MDRQSSGSGPVLGSGGGGSGREGLEPGGRDEVLSRRRFSWVRWGWLRWG